MRVGKAEHTAASASSCVHDGQMQLCGLGLACSRDGGWDTCTCMYVWDWPAAEMEDGIHAHVCVYVGLACSRDGGWDTCTCMCMCGTACACARMCVYLRAYVCDRTRMRLCVCVCVRARPHVTCSKIAFVPYGLRWACCNFYALKQGYAAAPVHHLEKAALTIVRRATHIMAACQHWWLRHCSMCTRKQHPTLSKQRTLCIALTLWHAVQRLHLPWPECNHVAC